MRAQVPNTARLPAEAECFPQAPLSTIWCVYVCARARVRACVRACVSVHCVRAHTETHMSVCVRTKYTHIATGSIICAPILQNEQQQIPLSVLSHTFGVCVYVRILSYVYAP